MRLLLRRWRQGKAGAGQVVLVSGEAGIGKSRLAAEVAARVAPEPQARARFLCSPDHRHSILYPVVVRLERAAGFADSDTEEQKLEKLATLLANGDPGDDEMQLIAELLSLPNTAGNLDRSPQRKRERLLQALLRLIEAFAEREPLLVTFEDVQWIDPTSRELLDLLIERIARWRLLLLVTFRPEFRPNWAERPQVSHLDLPPLDNAAGTALARSLAGDDGLDGELVGQVVECAEGVPLVAEELGKAVLETADREDALAAVLATGSAPGGGIPAVLQAALTCRLNRLGMAARVVAQTGAVLGREFSYELIRQTARRSDLDAALGQLTEAGLLFCRGAAPEAHYRFKHVLVRDAAYATLSGAVRQELHARVAAVLEQRFTELVERQPELVGGHLRAAGAPQRAIEFWFLAGERAKKRAADHEAVALLRTALRLTEELPDLFERAAWELRVSIALGPALMTTTGSAAPEVAQIYTRARQIAEEGGRTVRLFQALWASWLASFSAGDLRTTGGLVDQLFALGREQHSPELMLQAHHAAWTTAALLQGDLRAAQRSLESGMPFYRAEGYEHHTLLYGGHDAGICGYALGAMISALLGRLDRPVPGQAGLRSRPQLGASRQPGACVPIRQRGLLPAARPGELVRNRLRDAAVRDRSRLGAGHRQCQDLSRLGLYRQRPCRGGACRSAGRSMELAPNRFEIARSLSNGAGRRRAAAGRRDGRSLGAVARSQRPGQGDRRAVVRPRARSFGRDRLATPVRRPRRAGSRRDSFPPCGRRRARPRRPADRVARGDELGAALDRAGPCRPGA